MEGRSYQNTTLRKWTIYAKNDLRAHEKRLYANWSNAWNNISKLIKDKDPIVRFREELRSHLLSEQKSARHDSMEDQAIYFKITVSNFSKVLLLFIFSPCISWLNEYRVEIRLNKMKWIKVIHRNKRLLCPKAILPRLAISW